MGDHRVVKGTVTDGEGDAWQIALRFAFLDGKVRCTGLTLQSVNDGKPLTSSVLRSIPVNRYMDEVLREAHPKLLSLAKMPPFNDLVTLAEANLGVMKPPEGTQPPLPRRGRPTKYGAEHFASVARVYMNAPTKPTAAVAAHFDVSRTNAANWVRKARELGLISQSSPSHDRGVSSEHS